MWNEERLNVQGCSIRMRRASQGVPLPYLHGANGVAQMPRFLDAFTRAFDVLVPEQRGFGAADDPDWLECMDDLAHFYLDFLDQLGFTFHGKAFVARALAQERHVTFERDAAPFLQQQAA